MRIVTTPLPEPVVMPAPRPATTRSPLREACIEAPGISDAIAALGMPDTLAVTTGQQPALFTGPLYTIYKALSAAAVARILEQRWHRRVVPVFWLAGDDHDFAEANHASWLNADGALVTAVLRERPADAPLLPMYREPLGAEVEAVLARLETDLPEAEFKSATVDWLRRHFRPQATMAGAFGTALAELLAPFGIVCLDSTHPSIKRAAAPLMIQALIDAEALEAALDARSADLMGQGTDPGVAAADGATLVMVEGKQGRDRLVRAGTEYVTRRSRERWSLVELKALAEREPERLSPNVLLRPVIESAILPTVAYLAGPGELRYLPLSAPVYQQLGIAPQLPTPRWSGLMVEHRIERVLEKFGATLEDLLKPGHALESRVVRSQVPEEVASALERIRAEVTAGYARLAVAARDIDPTIEKPIQNLSNQALRGTEDAEKKLVQHLKKRADTELTQIQRARTALQPGGKPQERVLTAATFLARYGPTLLEEVQQAIAAWYAGALVAPVESS